MPASNKQARAALVAMLGQPMALVDGREGLVRAVAASYDGGRGLRPLFRQVGRRVSGAGAECVPSAAGKLARRLARKMLARRPDVGIFSLSEPSGGGACPKSSECAADATSSLGGRCVEAAPSSARQRGLQGVQDDPDGYECSGVYLEECCEEYRSICEDCAEDPSAEYCYPEVIAIFCGENAQLEGRYHFSQECVDFFAGGAASPPATPPAITTTVPQEIESTPVTSGGIFDDECDLSGVYSLKCCAQYRTNCESCAEYCPPKVFAETCGLAKIEGMMHYSQECIEALATKADEEEQKFQVCQSNCPDIAVCDCLYSGAPSANYNYSACVSTRASACRSGILPSCRETSYGFEISCPLAECHEKFGEVVPQCACASAKALCDYCDENPAAYECIYGQNMNLPNGQNMNDVCEDGSGPLYSQPCVDYFNGVVPGTTASAATESAQTTDVTTTTEESTMEESTTTTVATEASAGTSPDGGSSPSSAGKAAVGCAATLAALSIGISQSW